MPSSVLERRQANRRAPGSDETLARVRLRTGRELSVVNISPVGALVEGTTRLLPGTHVDVHIVTRHGRVLVRTRVVRAHVWHLEADLVCYQIALAFDTRIETDVEGYPVPAETPAIEGGEGSSYPEIAVEERA
jgi:hypothetical protein